MREISVIQIIANGENGYPKDSIVQIGIVNADMDSFSIVDEMLLTVRSDTDDWTQAQREYLAGKVSEEDIASGMDLDDAVKEVKKMIGGKDITSYEVRNSISRYLVYEPWDITFESDVLPSVSVRMPNNLRGCHIFNENLYIERAYARFIKRDIPQKKDALAYARMTAELMFFMRREGLY